MSWEKIIKRNCGCGKDPCETYGEVKKGMDERHFFEDGTQYVGETHKHPDGTLMNGKEHVEGKSKKLYHLYELDEKALKKLSQTSTIIKGKFISSKVMKKIKSALEGIPGVTIDEWPPEVSKKTQHMKIRCTYDGEHNPSDKPTKFIITTGARGAVVRKIEAHMRQNVKKTLERQNVFIGDW